MIDEIDIEKENSYLNNDISIIANGNMNIKKQNNVTFYYLLFIFFVFIVFV